MRAQDIIREKRDGGELDGESIRFFVEGASAGRIPDYQITAFLMAVFFRGMTAAETSHLTRAMRDSGEVVRFDLPVLPTDKHSTGGVGDKVSISLAPLVAACGVPVPMIAGRGLEHTGGTLDKLEAIPGFCVNLATDRFKRIVADVGACIMGQSERICPADRRFYALRDVTATVKCLPLIISSILCKKAAEGARALVLDVKSGSGAFMASEEDAERLARALCDSGRELGLRVRAVITDMDEPLGRTVGNALETAEAVDFLKGVSDPAYAELTYALAAHMVTLSGAVNDFDEAIRLAKQATASGAALAKFREMCAAQGGDARVADDSSVMGIASIQRPYTAPAKGFVRRMDVRKIGVAAMVLGAGRERAEDRIDPSVGFVFHKKPGDGIDRGEAILTIHANDEMKLSAAARILDGAFEIGEERPAPRKLIKKVIASE